jgi:DNA-binding NarL/FixJ family response regulator
MNSHAGIRLAPGGRARIWSVASDRDAAASLVRRVLILKADRQIAARINEVTASVFSDAEIKIVQRVSEATEVLAHAPVDLFITGFGMLDGDTCGLIRECAATPRRAARVLIVTGRRNPWLLRLLHELPIDGAFDSRSENADALAGSVRGVGAGRRSFSASFLGFSWAEQQPYADIFDLLTAAEVLVLVVLGDGCDRKTAADRLGLTLNTINSHCTELHRKLAVHHDRELMRIAASAGFVSFDGAQVVESYEQSQKQKRPRTTYIAALCAPSASCRRETRPGSGEPLAQCAN